MSVLVVLTNWKRPQNIPACIRAWRKQSVAPDKIIVVDNSPMSSENQDRGYERYPYPPAYADMPDNVWRIGENLGPPCRFAPALMLYQYEYTVFADDDLLPGSQAIEACLDAARVLEDEFATIGQDARIFNMVGVDGARYEYQYGNARRDTIPAPVDLTVRCHFFRTQNLLRAMFFRTKLLHSKAEGIDRLVGIHDDMLLCLGMQHNNPYPSYILPTSTLERQLIKENLPQNGDEACWHRPNHKEERQQFLDAAVTCGWRRRTP